MRPPAGRGAPVSSLIRNDTRLNLLRVPARWLLPDRSCPRHAQRGACSVDWYVCSCNLIMNNIYMHMFLQGSW